MAYDPSFYSPYYRSFPDAWKTNPMPTNTMSVNGIVYIDTIDDARNYQMPIDSVSPPLMLKSDNVFIIKTVDGSGGATLKAYRFEETELPSDGALGNDYVTKADLDAFAARIMEAIDGKLPIRESEPEE